MSTADLVVALGHALRRNQCMLVSAESCTGGLIAATCTDVAGSSDWFERGFVCYSNAAKTEMLDVDPQLIASYGAVSGEVAGAMAAGALARSHADLALAVTGIAGPSGATPGKPVGTVWFAWARRGEEPQSELVNLPGDRAAVREQAVVHALRHARSLAESATRVPRGSPG